MPAQMLIEGLQEALDAVFKDAASPEDKEIYLFSNDFEIADDTEDSDLTEITTNGGEKQTLTKANWGAASAADPTVIRYNGTDGVSWDITGDLDIRGWAIRGVTSGKLYAAENCGLKQVQADNTVKFAPIDVKLDIPEA